MTQLAAVSEVPTREAGIVKVREITLAEIRAHLAGAEGREQAAAAGAEAPDRGDLFVASVLGGFSIGDLKRFTDLDDARCSRLTPSEFRAVFETVKALNPDFFAVLDQWAADLVERMTSGLTLSEAP